MESTMATERIDIPVELFAQLEAKAKAEGKTVDEIACQALTDGLRDDKWQRLVAFGLENGRKSEFSEDQVVDVIHEWRKENRVR
jgi:hypothetical protein